MGMPIITGSGTRREQSITDLIESVALEQTALSHILNGEGKKLQKALLPCANFLINSENHLRVYDFVYNGVILYWGLNEQGYNFAVFELKDSISGTTTPVYSFHVTTFIEVGNHYIQEIINNSIDISETDANRIRNILFYSFPYASVAAIQAASGIAANQAECITAAQLAIWRLTNNFMFTHTNATVMALLEWYLDLPPIGMIIDPEVINLTAESIFAASGCAAKFTFSTPGENADETPVTLTYSFDKDIVAIYGAVIEETTVDGVTTVTVTNLPAGATFTLTVVGTQSLPEDAYRYINAQDLVGLFAQTNYMTATAEYECIGDCGANLILINNSINEMVDAVSLLEAVLQLKLGLFNDCLCNEQDS